MNIVVLGAGAMGSLFGGYLSKRNNVLLIDISAPIVSTINTEGLEITEPDGEKVIYHPQAATTAASAPFEKADLVIVFVKAMFSRSAICSASGLIGPDTYVMSLQNGSGHEDVLLEFADRKHVIIGTTQHNCSVLGIGQIKHGGSGITHIGKLDGENGPIESIAEEFSACNLIADCVADVNRLVWEKLFTNITASALTGALQVPLGFISSNENAWKICSRLLHEAIIVARADGAEFDEAEELQKVKRVCDSSPEGITSICADISKGRKTEVDTISGSVVHKAAKYGISVPSHEMLVNLIHALEAKQKS